jgi:O-antigen ligase
MTLLVVVLVATLHSQVTASSTGSTRLVGSYFQAVKKTDSTGFRAKLWNEALDEIRASPLVGSAFTGNVSLRRQLADRYYKIPVHSDFLLIGMGGGLVGLGLLVAWIVATNVVAVRRYWELIGTGGRGRANLLRALLVGFNAFFAVALVNPVMTQVGLCAAAMVLYSMLRSVDSPPVVADPAPAATP